MENDSLTVAVRRGAWEVGRDDLFSLRMHHKMAQVAQAALEGTSYDIKPICDLLRDVRRVGRLPKLITSLGEVKGKCLDRGRLTRIIYLGNVTSTALKCVVLLGSLGLPLFVTVAAQTKEVALPVFGFIAEVSVCSVAETLAVAVTVVWVVKDLNKLFELQFLESSLSAQEKQLMQIQLSLHLVKSSLKMARVALVLMGCINPALSVTLVLATIAFEKGVKLSRTDAFSEWALREPQFLPIDAA